MNATIRIAAPHWGHRSGSTSKICRNSSAQRRRASRNGSGTGLATVVGASAAPAVSQRPRRAPRTRIDRLGPCGRPVALVRAIAHLPRQRIALEALERDGIARGVPREAEREGDVAIGDEYGIVHVKRRVGPGQHRLGVVPFEQPAAHEEPEHGPAKDFPNASVDLTKPYVCAAPPLCSRVPITSFHRTWISRWAVSAHRISGTSSRRDLW